jgi:glycosyltransferase involved in cell wall biosynthesis
MKGKISVVTLTKNSSLLLRKCLASTQKIANEIIIVDSGSTDNTLNIAKSFNAQIFQSKSNNLGKNKAFGVSKTKNRWVLILDSDEIVSGKLANEINNVGADSKYSAYSIPFKNHFLGKQLKYGGENYQKIILFNKNKARMLPLLVHEKVEVISGLTGNLKNYIYHYSYRSIPQMFVKFTDYALREARIKCVNGEKPSFKKVLMYPPHMFYARFVKDKGYKDGLFRLPLDIGFAYMELVTYLALAYLNITKKWKSPQ